MYDNNPRQVRYSIRRFYVVEERKTSEILKNGLFIGFNNWQQAKVMIHVISIMFLYSLEGQNNIQQHFCNYALDFRNSAIILITAVTSF